MKKEDRDLRCSETQKGLFICGNPKKSDKWMELRVAPIRSLRNKINPETGRKYKFDE